MKIQLILLSFISFTCGSLTELRECIRPIAQLKTYLESMHTGEQKIRKLSKNAHECLEFVFERQRLLLRSFSTSGDELDPSPTDRATDSVRPRWHQISDEYITDFILRNEGEEFKAVLSLINDVKIVEKIEAVIAGKIIPKIDAKLHNMQERLNGLKFQAIEVLNHAESQAAILLQQYEIAHSNLYKSMMEKKAKRESLSELIAHNMKIFEQIEAPVLPSLSRKIPQEIAHNQEWRAAIKEALGAPQAVIAGRIRGIIREMPLEKQNQVITYVRNKMIKTYELEKSALSEKIAQDRAELEQIKSQETECLRVYSDIVLDQTWFTQIHLDD